MELVQETTIQIDNVALKQNIGPLLDDKEKVLSYVKAYASGDEGILAVTSKRLLYRGGSVEITMPYKRIKKAEFKKGFMSKKIVVEAYDTITFTQLEGGYKEVVARIREKLVS